VYLNLQSDRGSLWPFFLVAVLAVGMVDAAVHLHRYKNARCSKSVATDLFTVRVNYKSGGPAVARSWVHSLARIMHRRASPQAMQRP
jgi:hypothetical protein